jgi:streptomycin 6-kinase
MRFDDYLSRWNLTPDGEPITTPTSRLLPVRKGDEPAMLKVATEHEERWGAGLLVWWNGDGAVRVLAREGDAVLLERATGERSLAELARSGRDDEATQILCAAAAQLHSTNGRPPPPPLIDLSDWFRDLWAAADEHGDIIALAAATARELLADHHDVVPLHGDLHHGNVLDGGPRGWLAIDPKRLRGERAFDYVNILRNPDAEIALRPGRFTRQVDVICDAAGLDRERLIRWTLAFTGLSAAWILSDGEHPALDLAIAELARAELVWSAAET